MISSCERCALLLDAMNAKHDGDLTADEIASFVQDMDTDNLGVISLGTFRTCVGVKEGEDRVVGPDDTPELLSFRRDMRRISRSYQGVAAMVASLDKQGTGAVSLISLIRFLDEEGLFSGKRRTHFASEGKYDDSVDTGSGDDTTITSNKPLSKADIEKILDPITHGGKVNITNLMQVIEGKIYISHACRRRR